MKVVSRFEANLLRILHCFLRRAPLAQTLSLVDEPCPQPKCLSRCAVVLIQEALAQGCMLLLARAGGWRRERFLRGERVMEGRLWQRSGASELSLAFSANTLHFLIWITASRPIARRSAWVPRGDLTVADLLLLFFAYEALRETDSGKALASRPPFDRHALCWLAYPADRPDVSQCRPDFVPWTGGLGACILEAMQPRLAARWLEVERSKLRMTDWQAMQRLGRIQERVLSTFLAAVEAAGRRDLARFLLQVASVLLPGDATVMSWTGGLRGNTGPRLSDRTATNAAALACVRQLERLHEWERQARTVGYLDEGYAVSQFWKAEWERYQGPLLSSRALALLREIEPLRRS